MEIVSIERKTFEAMVAKFDHFVRRMDVISQRHGEKKNDRVDGQSRCVPNAEHQSAHTTDPAGQRHACLLADKPQDVLPSRRCAAHCLHCGRQAQGCEIQRKDNMNVI